MERGQLRLLTPAGAISPELRAELAERKAELIAHLGSTPSEAISANSIRKVSRDHEGPFAAPLSSAQERMWFLEQLQSNAANHIVMAFQVEGGVDTSALHQALDGLVQRHETLRTTFHSEAGRPVQVISETGIAAFDVKPATTQAEVNALLAAEAKRPFDLERGPLLRMLLLVRDPARHVLAVTIHHIVSDGLSLGIFLNELSVLYDAALRRTPSPLAPLVIQYADYAKWQRAWLAGEALAGQMEYWRAALASAPRVVNLPTDHQRPPVERHRGERIDIGLSADVMPELLALARRENATPFMVFMTAFVALLARYTGQEDLLVGTPVTGRSQPELEGLIGLFVNMLVFRSDTSGNPTLLDLFRRVRETAIVAYANQDVPFERLVEELRPERDLSRNPVFQVVFDLQNITLPPFPGFELRPVLVDRGAAQMDLTLSILRYDGQLHAQWEYSTDLFERATIERMAVHFETLLKAIVLHPEQRVTDLPLLTEAERREAVFGMESVRLICRWARVCTSDSSSRYGKAPDAAGGRLRGRAAYVLGAEPARQSARAPIAGSWREARSARGIAHRSQRRNGGRHPGHPQVGRRIPAARSGLSEGSRELHARGCERIVRVDPGEHGRGPRMRFPSLRCLLDEPLSDDETIRRRLRHRNISPTPSTPPAPPASRRVSSSRTTTWPACWMPPRRGTISARTTSGRCFTRTRSISRYGSSGARCCTAAGWWSFRSGSAVLRRRSEELLITERVTVLNQTPSAFRQLVQADLEHRPASYALRLRHLRRRGAGAAEPASVVRSLRRRPAAAREHVWHYRDHGACHLSAHPHRRPRCGVGERDRRAHPRSPGLHPRPHGRPQPVGIPGEMYVGGAGVARGYLNRPDLTNERFIQDPFAASAGARLYRSGDLARRLGNGDIEYPRTASTRR